MKLFLKYLDVVYVGIKNLFKFYIEQKENANGRNKEKI